MPARRRSRRRSDTARPVSVATRRWRCRRTSSSRGGRRPASSWTTPSRWCAWRRCLRIADLAQADGDVPVLADQIAAGAFDRDRGLMDAATAAAARHDAKVLEILTKHNFDRPPSPDTLTIVSRLAEHHARGGPADTAGAIAGGPHGGRPPHRPGDRRRVRGGLAEGQGPRSRRRLGGGPRRPPAEAAAGLARPDARPRLALGREGAGRIRRPARRRLPRRGGRRIEARGRPHRLRPPVDRPAQDRPAGRPRRHRPGHGEDAARPGERPDRRRGAERRPRGRDGAGGRDGADDPGRPQGERAGTARQDRMDERPGDRDRGRASCRCPSCRSTSRRRWRPTPTGRSPTGPRRCSPRGAGCPTRTARRSSRSWRRSS